MIHENIWEFMKSKNQPAKRTTLLDVIVIAGAWLIALALLYIVLAKFRILNIF